MSPSLNSPRALGQLFVVLLVLSSLSGCRSQVSAANASQEQAVPVTIQSLRSDAIEDGEEFVAKLVSRQSVELKPRVSGQVVRIFVQPGESINAGSAVLQIDAREERASVASKATTINAAAAGLTSAQADTQQAIANVERARASAASASATLANLRADRTAKQAELKLAQQQYERYTGLAAQGAVSQQVLDEYTNQLEAAKASLNALDARIAAQQSTVTAEQSDIAAQQAVVTARQAGASRADQQVQQAQADTQEAKARLQYYSINAPFAGTVSDIPVKEGDFVDDSTILTTLTQNGALELNVQVPIERATKLSMGTRIMVLNGEGKAIASSRVFFIAPNADPSTQSVLVKAQLENGSGNLRADQNIRAKIIWNQRSSLLVPITAISRIAGQNFVYVAEEKDGKLIASQKPIQLGVIQGNQQQVTSGLDYSDKIITSGIQKIADGKAIVNAETLKQQQQ